MIFIPKDKTSGDRQEYTVNKFETNVFPGFGIVRCNIEDLPLKPDDYSITATVYDSSGIVAFDHFEMAKTFKTSAKRNTQDKQRIIAGNWDKVNKEHSTTTS